MSPRASVIAAASWIRPRSRSGVAVEAARPAIQARLDEARDYRPNRYALSAEWKARLAHHWGFYFDRYGYEREPGTAAVPQAAAPSDG